MMTESNSNFFESSTREITRFTFSKGHKWNSQPSNCLSTMNTTTRLPGNSHQLLPAIPIKHYSRGSGLLTCVHSITLITLLMTLTLPGINATTITTVSPSIIPIQGHVTLFITGTGFQAIDYPKCQLQTPNSVLAINDNTVINDSLMKCTIPGTTSIQRNSFTDNGNKASLTVITGFDGILELTFFNQEGIMVTSLYPDWTYTSSHAHVSVAVLGSGFVQTNHISCYSSLFEVKAVFVNTTQLMCQFPPQIVTMTINIAVYSIGQPSSIIQGSGSSLGFTYFATPPQALYFKFDPSYTQLILQFDREIELGNETEFNTTTEPDCDIIFKSINAFGSPKPTCYWQNTQQRQIIIEFNSLDSTILPNTSIPLNNNILRTRYVSYSKLTAGSVLVEESDDPLHPVAIIEGPQYLPYCGEYTLSGHRSYNRGPRPLQYAWNISLYVQDPIASGEEDISEYAIGETNVVPSGMADQPSISVMAELFDAEVEYQVVLTVTNFLGRVDQVSFIVTKRDLPALNVWILGDNPRVIDPMVPLFIEGMITIPTCVDTSSTISYNWVLSRDGGIIELDDMVTSNQYLLLQANTLTSNTTYTLSFHASVGVTVLSMANLTILTIPMTVKAVIFGGTFILYGVDNALILDPTYSHGLTSDIEIHWSCWSEQLNSTCTHLLSDTSDLITTIPAGILPPSSSYIITLQLLYSSQVVSTSQQAIHILNNTNGARVYIEEPLNSDRVNVHRRLIIKGIVESIQPGEVTWSSVYKPGYAFLTLNEHSVTDTPLTLAITDDMPLQTSSETNHRLSTSTITPSSPYVNPVSLSITSDQLLPDNRYCFRLTVTPDVMNDIMISDRYAEIEIHTAPQPSFGGLSITPLTGHALDTVFSIQGMYWTVSEGNYPLYYRFGFEVEHKIKWLTSRTQYDSIATILPYIGQDSLTVVLEVTDSNNITTIVTKIVTVVAMDTIDLSDIDDQIRAKVSGVSELNQYYSHFVSVLFTIDTLSSIAHEKVMDFKTSMCKFLLDLYKKGVFPMNIESHYVLVSVLKSLSSDMSPLPDSYLDQLLWLLEGIVSESNGLIAQEGIGMVHDLITIYGNMLSLQSELDSDHSRISSDKITKHFDVTYESIGHSICQNTGLFSPNQHINNDVIGSVKVYHGLPLPHYNLSCDHTLHNGSTTCPFTPSSSSYVTISDDVFSDLLESSCGEYGIGNKPCANYCFVSRQLINDIHWSGSPYASIVKSYPVSYHLSPLDASHDVSLSGPIDYNVLLKQTPSNSGKGKLKCVYWDNSVNDWVEDGCSIKETGFSSSVVNISTSLPVSVQCSCQVLKEVVVIEECQPGYYGVNCDQVCPYGLHGNQCSGDCECTPMGWCSPSNGSCDCSPGWIGARCDTICPVGTWGKYCAKACQCENGASCDPVDGGCSCTPGWIGQYCDIECPIGFYGDNCVHNCSCRSDTECDPITGNCTCEAGYTGLTCHSPCPDNYYGINCTSECECVANGTEYCDNINGTCHCRLMWGGDYCETPPYSPTVPIPVDSLPIWVVIVPPIAGILCALVVILIIVLVYVSLKKRKRQKTAIFPVEGDDGGEGSGSKKSSFISEEFELTRAKSRTLVVPQGKTLKDVFHDTDNDNLEFKEPEVIGANRRWQIIQVLLPTESTKKHSPKSAATKESSLTDHKPEEKMKVESGIEIESLDSFEEESMPINPTSGSIDSASYEEIVYRKGIYLNSDATLKDLRNGFIDSGQLDKDDVYFKFLNSDIPGDYILIDDEEETLLTKLEPNLLFPRSVFIELVDKNTVTLELCVCGKFAELECIECRAKGYCSEQCQTDHWMAHSSTCRIVSARRRKAKKMKKKRKKLEKMMRQRSANSLRGGFTPNPDRCICGKEAQYECSECSKQGYCSERCQQEDWELHQLFCEGQQNNNNNHKLNVIVEDEGSGADDTVC